MILDMSGSAGFAQFGAPSWAYTWTSSTSVTATDPIICLLEPETLSIPTSFRDFLCIPSNKPEMLRVPVSPPETLRC